MRRCESERWREKTVALMREVAPRFDVVLQKKALVRGDCDLDSNKEAVGRKLPTAFSIGVTGFEPATSWSQTTRATELRHTPKSRIILSHFFTPAQEGAAKGS